MTISLGRLQVDRIAELDHWPFAPADLFPTITSRHLAGQPAELDLSITTHLVRTPGLTVLLDAGNGNDKQRPVLRAHHQLHTDYLQRLTEAGTRLEDVDIVVATHLHPDHCGGFTRLVDGCWTPTFPNARYLVPRDEYGWLERLHARRPTDGVAADLAATFADSVLPVAESGQLDIIDLPHALTDGITLRALPGHTAGHLIAELGAGDTPAIVSGDVLHHPLQLADLTLAQGGDADPATAAASRRALCELALDRDALLLPAHFGGAAGGRITRNGDAFGFQQR